MDELSYELIKSSPAAFLVSSRLVQDRLDAVFFQPQFARFDAAISESDLDVAEIGSKKVTTLFTHMPGFSKDKWVEYVPEGIPYLLQGNVQEGYVDPNDWQQITPLAHANLKTSQLKPGDVLLTATGMNYGKAAVVPKWLDTANVCPDIFRVVLRKGIDPYYIASYLNSEYGQIELRRHGSGANRPRIITQYARKVRVVLPLLAVQTYIGDKVRLAERCRMRALELRQEAQRCLDSGIEVDINTSTSITHGKRFHTLSAKPEVAVVDSTMISARLDAAAYSPIRLSLLDLIQDARSDFRPINEVAVDVTRRRKRYKREQKGFSYFVSILHLNDKGVIDHEEAETHFPVSSGYLCRVDDILFSGINPRQNRIAVWTKADPTLCSAEFSIYRARGGFSPFYLAFVWRNAYCLNQLEALTRGTSSSRRRLKEEDFAELLVPVLNPDDRELIARCEQRAVKLDIRAKELTDEAKADVEALIEGRLDVEGILDGQVKAPTWEDIAV